MSMDQSTSDILDLYRELIIDHAHNPRNFRSLAKATHSSEGINPLCGDKLHLHIKINSRNIIEDISFEGSGCAVSMASASLLTESIKNLPVSKANDYFELVIDFMLDKKNDSNLNKNINLSKLKALEGIKQYPIRIKCATLAWHALHAAINKTALSVTTE